MSMLQTTTETARTLLRNHKRTYSAERGPGAFASLGSLPKFTQNKKQPAVSTPPAKKSPVFSFEENDYDDDDDDDDDDDVTDESSSFEDDHARRQGAQVPAMKELATLRPESPQAIPFPRSTSVSPPPDQPNTFSSSDDSLRPHLTRGVSTPTIVLSNGKPLKSSLKSSSSSPSVNTPTPVFGADFKRLTFHTRAASAPATPNSIHKAVHFPDNKEAGLEDVRLFNRTAKPLAVSRLGGEETETETEGEPSSFPFPRFVNTFSSSAGLNQPMPVVFEIDHTVPSITSPVPAPHPPPHGNVHLESIKLTTPSLTPSSPFTLCTPYLSGTVLVRNIAFEKHVAVRFTLDEWQTTSEVRARHTSSVIAPSWERPTVGDAVAAIAAGSSDLAAASWDRFAFTIKLEDHAYKLQDRVLWMVVRYSVGGGAEWWDNNSDRNYRVGFRMVTSPTASPVAEKKRTVSAPESALKHSITTEPNLFGAGFDFSTVMPNRAELAKIETSPTSSTSSLTRSSKLSLSNYVSPSVSPISAPLRTRLVSPARSPASTPSSSSSASLTDLLDVLTPRPVRPATFLTPPSKPSQDSSPNLRWPWGGINSPARMLSPLASPALSTPLPAGSGMATPREGSDEDLYKAFVQQWCFAQSGPTRPPTNDSVLVGS